MVEQLLWTMMVLLLLFLGLAYIVNNRPQKMMQKTNHKTWKKIEFYFS